MPRVLVIDDDQSIRTAVEALLELHGFTVDTAVDGADAFRSLQANSLPDAILVDLMMPVMDGWTFVEELRHIPTYAGIPLIVMSAVAPQSIPGVRETLLKPVEPSQLLDAVTRATTIVEGSAPRRRRIH